MTTSQLIYFKNIRLSNRLFYIFARFGLTSAPRSTGAELGDTHKTSENRGSSITSLRISITCSASSAASLSLTDSRYWKRTHQVVVQVNSTDAVHL